MFKEQKPSIAVRVLAAVIVAPVAGPVGLMVSALVQPFAVMLLLVPGMLLRFELFGFCGAVIALPFVSAAYDGRPAVELSDKQIGIIGQERGKTCGIIGLTMVLLALLLIEIFDASNFFNRKCYAGALSCIVAPALFMFWVLLAACAGSYASGFICSGLHEKAIHMLTKPRKRSGILPR